MNSALVEATPLSTVNDEILGKDSAQCFQLQQMAIFSEREAKGVLHFHVLFVKLDFSSQMPSDRRRIRHSMRGI